MNGFQHNIHVSYLIVGKQNSFKTLQLTLKIKDTYYMLCFVAVCSNITKAKLLRIFKIAILS